MMSWSAEYLSFDTALQQGVQAHAAGDYETALEYRLDAFAAWPPQPYDRARAARDIAASFDRLGDRTLGDPRRPTNAELADAYGEYAYREHSVLGTSDEYDDEVREHSTREFTVSAMYMATRAARRKERAAALYFIREGWETAVCLYEQTGQWHQYDINMIGRVAGIEGAYGGKPTKDIRTLGRLAGTLADRSETDEVLGYTDGLDAKSIARAQRNAALRGKAARTIIRLQTPPTRWFTRPLANYILQRAVL